jgi:hypothetical protein
MPQQIITLEDLEQFRVRLLQDMKLLFQPTQNTTKQWLRSSELRKMLGISHGTLQNLRITGVLPYRKIGGIMFYNYEDILRLLEKGSSSELKKQKG